MLSTKQVKTTQQMGRLQCPTAEFSPTIWGYMVRLYDRHLRSHKDTKHLPFVVPVVFYHGHQQAQYRTLKDLFSGAEVLLRYVPDFEYDFVNITLEDDAKLRGQGEIHAAMLLMKHIFDPDFPARVPEIMALLSRIYDARTGIEAMGLYFEYIMAGAVNADPDELLKTLNEQGGKIMPSLAKKLYDEGLQDGRQEGLKEGIEKGMEKGIEKGIENGIEATKTLHIDMMEGKFGVLEPGLVARIQAAGDLDTLQRLRDAIKKSDSMESLLKALGA